MPKTALCARESNKSPDTAFASRLIFYEMPELPSTPALRRAGSFASLLESFTSSPTKTSQAWDDRSLGDDVAVISYEQALRAHRRAPAPAGSPANELQFTAAAAVKSPSVTAGKQRKTASITVRLTEEEEIQLHQRANAAQLSVSAYLRSCIFEAESLRAQVKEALSQMKAAATSEAHAIQEVEAKPTPNWRTRFLPNWRRPASA
jgi:hypothetical protein